MYHRSPSRPSCIDEESLFKYLSWISPSISALIAAMHLSENLYFYRSMPNMLFYSCCSKTPMPPPSKHTAFAFMSLKIYVICALFCIVLELCAHVAIFRKQTQVESRSSSEYIVRNNQRVSSQRHQGPNSIEKVVGLSFGLKNGLRFHFDSDT